MMQKKQYPFFAFLRSDLLGNELLYTLPKALIISEVSQDNLSPEERFAEPNIIYPVSVLTKPGSGKLELDDRFEFTIQEGFKVKTADFKQAAEILSSQSKMPISTFNLESKKSRTDVFEAKILVEDSDRDSEDEMEADSNF